MRIHINRKRPNRGVERDESMNEDYSGFEERLYEEYFSLRSINADSTILIFADGFIYSGKLLTQADYIKYLISKAPNSLDNEMEEHLEKLDKVDLELFKKTDFIILKDPIIVNAPNVRITDTTLQIRKSSISCFCLGGATIINE